MPLWGPPFSLTAYSARYALLVLACFGQTAETSRKQFGCTLSYSNVKKAEDISRALCSCTHKWQLQTYLLNVLCPQQSQSRWTLNQFTKYILDPILAVFFWGRWQRRTWRHQPPRSQSRRLPGPCHANAGKKKIERKILFALLSKGIQSAVHLGHMFSNVASADIVPT